MDFSATQIYEDENVPSTQISHEPEDEELVQAGSLKIGSKEYPIKTGITKIGRHSICDIVIKDVAISKQHAEIEVSGGSTWISDLNSSNKTKLNNCILRARRLYELKDGSDIHFGTVHASYHTYCPRDNIVVPETPAPSMQKIACGIIPNTPDSSLTNSSGVDNDGSIIYGTQNNEDSIFRRPQTPHSQSTSSGLKNISTSESNDSQTGVLHASIKNSNEDQVNIYDAETQKFEKEYDKVVSKSIHDLETQIPEYLVERNAKEANLKQAETSKSATDICDMETQKLMNDINKTDSQKNEIDKTNSKKDEIDKTNSQKNEIDNSSAVNENFTMDIHTIETQKCNENETQFAEDSTLNEINTTKDRMSPKNITKPPDSKSNSPRYLNLSSPEIEDCPSPLNQSSHLLETSYLLEFFGEDIDKQKKIQPSNTSTPKPLTKVSLENKNTVNNEEDDDEDIFEASTQCNSNFEALISDDSETKSEKDMLAMRKVSKKKSGKSRPEQTNDDSETDAEEYIEQLVKTQQKSSRLQVISNEFNEDTSKRNDLSTSSESDDIFNLPTQKMDSFTINKTSNSINQSQKLDEINKIVDDMESMQKDTAATHINTKSVDCGTKENLDCENIDYELAPTQLFDEIDKTKKNSICEKDSSQVNVNDILEEKLNNMFDVVNNDRNKISDLPYMSTQSLQDILESQSDDVSNSDTDDRNIDNMSRKQLKKTKSNSLNTEIDVNDANEIKTNLQESNVNFSPITAKRKKNIKDLDENVTVCQNVNSSSIFKVDNKKTVDDNTAVKFNNKRKKRMPEAKNESGTIMETLNDDKNKYIPSGDNERSLRNLKLMKQTNKAIPETNKQVFERDSVKVDAAGEKTSCIPCPSADGQRMQTLSVLYEIGDDILAHLPAVRISGTLSNPPSPSASSTSTVHSTYKQSIAKTKKTQSTPMKKKLCKRDIRNLEKNDKPSVVNCSNSVIGTPTTVKTSKLTITSEDSETDSETDNEIKYKRFEQIANRMLSNTVKQHDIKNRKIISRSPDLSKDLILNSNVESKRFTRSSRLTQHSSRQQIDKHSYDFQRETLVKSTAMKDKSETQFTVDKKKKSVNKVEESMEPVTSKKRKIALVPEKPSCSTRSRRNTMKIATDRQSPDIFEHFTEKSSSETSPTIERTKFFKDNKTEINTTFKKTRKTPLNINENIDLKKSNIKRTKRITYDSQVMHSDTNGNGDSKKNTLTQIKEMQVNQLENKILKVVLNPIKYPSSDNESQEVEIIMAKSSCNVQDKNLSIRESTKAKLFKKRFYSDTETDSVLTETVSSGIISSESISSEIEDSNDTHFNSLATRPKRGKLIKSSISSLTEAQVSKKKETFKKPINVKNSTGVYLDSSAESTACGENSNSSTENYVSTSFKSLRSKAANIKKQKAESNQNTEKLIDKMVLKLHINAENASLVSTPCRTRRSTSTSSSSTPTAIKYNILFTGITDDYSKIIKKLGGCKVENPAKCSILVTDKVRRTYKFLCALARGIPIVTINWLIDSEAAAQFLNWENYILKDPAAEAKFGFRLRKSLDIAKKQKMLDGFTVILTPNIAPPPVEELKDMVLSCGGKALLRAPTKWPEKAIILSREEDLLNAKKFLAKAPKNVTVQSTEFILTGILKQETDFNKYKLAC
ncbi:hypothetical protein PUN28_002746 [Cardiocondyla obscurior]|uniref:Mediator of DNA damage checkpoint protein 1 n=1 Tax=Cardiocondyla obscurior TaxID=286306 RepID=A0AAW2GVV3_9HYME